ncbi:MAG TPA: M50 family metallopeptidase [Patescibacteria group bacterium]|nr:M50 family metallopeptidase [Patescibacteria group bacterium]
MTLLIFLIILSVLVFVHELGHFIVAKKSGMNVEEFGFGFPPRLIGVQKKDGNFKVIWGPKQVQDKQTTVYSINWIFAGGFVKITGENNDDENHASFVNKPFSARFFTLTAGVIMNVLLAVVLYAVSFNLGAPLMVGERADLPCPAEGVAVTIHTVVPGSPADHAGIKVGDQVLGLDGIQVHDTSDVISYIKTNAGKSFNFTVRRQQVEHSLAVNSAQTPPPNQGPTGIGLGLFGTVKCSPALAIKQGVIASYYGLINIPLGLYDVFTSGAGFQALGGPVRIYQETDKVKDQAGVQGLIPFAAFLSLNLAFLNILPIPALDGGRVMFLLIEKIRRKRNRQIVEQTANAIGFLLLLLLLVAISIKDVFVR